MNEKFTLYDDSKYENHATNELPLASKDISKKGELSKAYIKPIILYRNNHLEDDNWELGLDYTDFTGSDVQNAFESGWDASKEVVIDKACEWLNGVIYEYINLENVDTFIDSNRKLIEDFRKAMEE